MSDGKDAVREIFKRLNEKQMKLLYFSAPWCGPCKMFGPIMEKVQASGVPVEKVNVDEDQDLSIKYEIRNVPTVVKINPKGEVVDKFTGAKSQQDVINFYNG
jgi:thioredoxin 1